jgi:prepilin-type N-terminal cleavage/methylation domain-containing protein
MRKPLINGFTLIEMLTVIVIVGIMLALTIPAVTSLMKSSGVSVATRQVSNTLGLARQLAITQRVYARVVFPYDTVTPLGTESMLYRAYAVMINRDNSAAAIANWKYVSKWEYLPVGVVFLNRAPLPAPPPATGALDDTSSLNRGLGLPFPETTVAPATTLAYIEFTPSGTATAVGLGTLTPSVLTITEGFANSGSPPTLTSKTSLGALANVGTLTVNSLVGRIQVTRP